MPHDRREPGPAEADRRPVTCGDAIWALRQASRRYDLVLVDPPYEAWGSLEPKLAAHLPPVLAPDGLLVVETGSRMEPAFRFP